MGSKGKKEKKENLPHANRVYCGLMAIFPEERV